MPIDILHVLGNELLKNPVDGRNRITLASGRIRVRAKSFGSSKLRQQIIKKVFYGFLGLSPVPFGLRTTVDMVVVESDQLVKQVTQFRGHSHMIFPMTIPDHVLNECPNELPICCAQSLPDLDRHLVSVDELYLEGILNILARISDFVNQSDNAPFQCGWLPCILARSDLLQVLLRARRLKPASREIFPAMRNNPITDLPREVESGPFPVPLGNRVNDSESVYLVREPRHQLFQQRVFIEDPGKEILSLVPERCMTNVVSQAYRLCQVLIQPKTPGHSPSGRCNKPDMVHPCANVIILRKVEDLRFVPQTPEGL